MQKLPRVRLANLPTPFQEMPNLSRRLGGPKIFIKRDDLTGLAFGGNKTRKLEFIMADAKSKGADVVIAARFPIQEYLIGFQSNFCSQIAAAARRLGMGAVLVKNGPRDDYDPEEYDGNHLLQFILGADFRVRTPEHAPKLEDVAEELKKEGHVPYIIEWDGGKPGVFGYVNAMQELLSQTIERGMKTDYVVVAAGSGGTLAGLILGAKIENTSIKVLGISVTDSGLAMAISEHVSELVKDSAKFLGADVSIGKGDVTLIDGYAKEGYGVINEGKVKAIQLVAQTEGIFLDPVYSGTAMAGLIDLIRNGYFDKQDNVVFIHTGGIPALFPYKEPIKSILTSKSPPWTTPPWASRGAFSYK